MSLFEMFVNKDPLRRQRDRAKEFALEAYDPNVFNEALNVAREQGVEGISQGVEDLSRSRTLQSLFRERDMGLYGGNVGAAIAGSQAGDTASRTAMAGFEADMAIADEQARQAGRQQYGQIATQQAQIQSQQKAALKEADLQYEAEVDRRAQKIGGTALQIGLMAATTPFGGGGSLLARGLGAVAGGAAGEVAGEAMATDAVADTSWVDSMIPTATDAVGSTIADQLGTSPLAFDEEPVSLMTGDSPTLRDLSQFLPEEQEPAPYSTRTMTDIMGRLEDPMDDPNFVPSDIPSFEEFKSQKALEAASGFQNYDTEMSEEGFEQILSPFRFLLNSPESVISKVNPLQYLNTWMRNRQSSIEKEYRNTFGN